MPGLGYPVGSWMGADTAVTNPTADVEDAANTLRTLFPPGNLYDLYNPKANVYKILAAFGEAAKYFGFDVADRLFIEFNPATCVEKIPDWESALDIIPGTQNATFPKTTPQRQQAIVAKLRESGASTLANIRAAVAPWLGYADPSTLVIYEVDRDTLTTTHTYAGGASTPIGASSTAVRYFSVPDDGLAVAGVRLTNNFTGVNTADLIFSLIAPDGTFRVWTGLPTGMPAPFYLYAPTDFATSNVNGTWRLVVQNTGGTSGTWVDSSLFVEGLGPAGLGGDIYYWGVYVDPTLANSPDLVGAARALVRVNPAHAGVFLITSIDPWPDVISGAHQSIPDMCIPV